MPGGMGGGMPGGGMGDPGGSGGMGGMDDPQQRGEDRSSRDSAPLAPGQAEANSGKEYSIFDIDRPSDHLGPQYGYDRIRLHKKDEVSPYAQQEDARHRMDPRNRSIIIIAVIVLVIFVVGIFLPDAVFNTTYVNASLATWVSNLTENVQNFTAALTFQAYSGQMVFKICQYIICMLAGAGLAVTGAMFQGALKNAMAAPSTLGVTSGAQVGVVIFVLLGGASGLTTYATRNASEFFAPLADMNIFEYIWATSAQSLCALAGSFVVVMLVLLIAYIAGRGKVSRSALIIAGSVFTSVITGVVQLVRYYLTVKGDSDEAEAVTSLATGSLSSTFTPFDLALAGIPILICLIILFCMRRRMNLLAFSEEEARSMGLSPQFSRNVTIAVCTILTAVITAFCGGIGFVGFLAPHLVRRIVGPDFTYLVPASMFIGAGITLLSNIFANQALNGMGMGSVAGIIGAVVFLYTIIRQRGRGNADWI